MSHSPSTPDKCRKMTLGYWYVTARYTWFMEARANATSRTRFGGRPVHVAVGGDERLAQLVAGGSERAFVALYERYYDQLYRYCRSIVRDDSDAQDAVQSTLTGAFAALRRGRRDAPLRPWLFRIAHNESVSVLRRRRPEEQLSELLPDRTGSTEERVEQRERLALLMADLHALPERQRGALVMRELNDLSHEQIAIALRTSVAGVKQTIFEARRALLEFAEGRTMACDNLQRTISDADGRALRGRRVRAHLRDCPACAAFAAGISARRAALQAVVPPLPAIAASSLLARVLAGTAGEAATGAGGVVAGVAGKTAGAVLASKALAGVVLVTTAAVGTTTAATQLTHPPTRTARGTPVGTVDGTPLTSGAHPASRMQRAAGGAAASPPAASAPASPHAGPAGQSSAAGSPATSGADAVRAGQGAGGSTAGNGGAAQSPSHPGRSSTAPGRAVSQGGGPPAAAPGGAAAKGGGRSAAPGRAVSQGGGPRAAAPGGAAAKGGGRSAAPGRAVSQGGGPPAAAPGRAVPKGGGPAAASGRAASQGASHPPAPPAASSGAPQAQSAARPAPPGHAASQGSSQPPGPLRTRAAAHRRRRILSVAHRTAPRSPSCPPRSSRSRMAAAPPEADVCPARYAPGAGAAHCSASRTITAAAAAMSWSEAHSRTEW
jgi:RNA polymerase sigma factor (sigma-70 family)